MSTVANCIMENIENATERFQILLKDLPSLHCYKSELVYVILDKLYKELSKKHGEFSISLNKQRKMIPLLQFCFKTSKVMSMNLFSIREKLLPDYSTDHIMYAEIYAQMLKLDDEIKSEFFNVMNQDNEMKLSVVHYQSHPSEFSLDNDTIPPSSLAQVAVRQSKYLVDLKLFCRITMPNCRLIHLRELHLRYAKFKHEPMELKDMPLLV